MCRTGGEEEEMRRPALRPGAGIPGDGEGARCSAKHETGDGGTFYTRGEKAQENSSEISFFTRGQKPN